MNDGFFLLLCRSICVHLSMWVYRCHHHQHRDEQRRCLFLASLSTVDVVQKWLMMFESLENSSQFRSSTWVVGVYAFACSHICNTSVWCKTRGKSCETWTEMSVKLTKHPQNPFETHREPHDTLQLSGLFYVNFFSCFRKKSCSHEQLKCDDWLAETDGMSHVVYCCCLLQMLLFSLRLRFFFFSLLLLLFRFTVFCIRAKKHFFANYSSSGSSTIENWKIRCGSWKIEIRLNMCVMCLFKFLSTFQSSWLYNKYKSSVLPLHPSLNRS